MTAEPTAKSPGIRHSLAPATGVGAVHLQVSDRRQALDFYQDVLGLETLRDEGDEIALGAGMRELVVLYPGASTPVRQGTTGLYHLAIVLPTRRELARFIARLMKIRYPNSPTDHVLTKADYLWDPDGNGIEVYAETPEDGTWFFTETGFGARDAEGRLRSGRDPIDLQELFTHLTSEDDLASPMADGTKMGHVHLHVRDVFESVDFYGGLIGFDLMGLSNEIGMAFVSAGGYHHHLGLNTWAGKGAPPPPPGAAGLRRFTIEVPDPSNLQSVLGRLDGAGLSIGESSGEAFRVQDPSRNQVELKVRV